VLAHREFKGRGPPAMGASPSREVQKKEKALKGRHPSAMGVSPSRVQGAQFISDGC